MSTFGIRATDGSAGTPTISFQNDQDCGLYRIGADNVGLTLGGTKRVDFATTGVTVTGTITASGKAAVGGAAISTYNLEIASHARIVAAGEVSLQLQDTTTGRFELVMNSSGFAIRDAGSGTPTKLLIAPSTGAVSITNTLAVGGNVGFFGTSPAAKPTVSGSRGGNAALASLLTGLASLGLVTDSSS